MMRLRGINYDVGFSPAGTSSRKLFDPEVVRREMQVIAGELHANAVRVTGADHDRLAVAAAHAADAGLEVWFAPFPYELAPEALMGYFADGTEMAAARARHRRASTPNSSPQCTCAGTGTPCQDHRDGLLDPGRAA